MLNDREFVLLAGYPNTATAVCSFPVFTGGDVAPQGDVFPQGGCGINNLQVFPTKGGAMGPRGDS